MASKSTKNFVQDVVAPAVNKERQERIKARIEKVRGEGSDGLDWSADSWMDDVREVFRIVEDWEDNLAEIDDAIAGLTGEAGSMHFREQMLADLKPSREELRNKRIPGETDNYTVGVKEVADKYEYELDPRRVKARAWKSSQKVVLEAALQQLREVCRELSHRNDAYNAKEEVFDEVHERIDRLESTMEDKTELMVLRAVNGGGAVSGGDPDMDTRAHMNNGDEGVGKGLPSDSDEGGEEGPPLEDEEVVVEE